LIQQILIIAYSVPSPKPAVHQSRDRFFFADRLSTVGKQPATMNARQPASSFEGEMWLSARCAGTGSGIRTLFDSSPAGLSRAAG
jgi:hypothetical protein